MGTSVFYLEDEETSIESLERFFWIDFDRALTQPGNPQGKVIFYQLL